MAGFVCNFCGKDQDEVQQLIVGPDVYICNECAILCADIIREKQIELAHDEVSRQRFLEFYGTD